MPFELGKFLNPDVLYALAGLGTALGKDNPFAVGAGGLTMGMIKNDQYKALLEHILGAGGKLTMDGQKFSVSGPSSLINQGQNAAPGDQTFKQPEQPAQSNLSGGLGILNPSHGSLDLSGLSLASLSPQEITEALKLGLLKEEISRKAIGDLYQSRYWEELIKEKQAERERKLMTVPDTRPGSVREYEYAKSDPGFEKWLKEKSASGDPTSFREYERAMKDPEYMKFLKEIAEARRPSLGEVGGKTAVQEEARRMVRDKLYPSSEELAQDIDKYISSKEYRDSIFLTPPPTSEEEKAAELQRAKDAGYDNVMAYRRARAAAEKQRDFIRNRLINRGFIVKSIRADKGNWVFTIEHPDGTIEEKSYAVRF